MEDGAGGQRLCPPGGPGRLRPWAPRVLRNDGLPEGPRRPSRTAGAGVSAPLTALPKGRPLGGDSGHSRG